MQLFCVVVGLVSLASARPLPPDVDLVGGWELEISIQHENSSTTRPFAEDCQEFCSLSYPEHTYPEPDNFKACTTGCRAAQLDAFIAWPVKAEVEKCKHACGEMYSTESQQFACITGCKTPTIDSTFPNRDHLYGDGNATSEIDLLLPPVEDTFSYILNSFFSPQSSNVFEDLTEHAQNMEVLVVPYLRSDVTVLTNDGVYTYREYSFDNGGLGSMVADKGDTPSRWSGDSWLDHYHEGDSICVWPLHRAMLNRFLMVLSVGVLIAAFVMCCLSPGGKKIPPPPPSPPKIPSVKTNPPLSTKKAPYDHEFIVPEKVHLGTGHKITML